MPIDISPSSVLADIAQHTKKLIQQVENAHHQLAVTEGRSFFQMLLSRLAPSTNALRQIAEHALQTHAHYVNNY